MMNHTDNEKYCLVFICESLIKGNKLRDCCLCVKSQSCVKADLFRGFINTQL